MLWIYGPPKIGKTTLASQFPGCWFLATEKGQDFVYIREPTPIDSWTAFIEWCCFMRDEVLATKHLDQVCFGDGKPIRTLVIDTVEILYAHCQEYICANLGVENPGDLDHGKGWGRLSEEFARVMGKVRSWPFTLVCISHDRQKEFKTKGRKTDRNEPNIGAGGFRWCQSAADLILYAHSAEIVVRNTEGEITGDISEHRALLCHPQSWAVAGGRMSNRLPTTIPLEIEGTYETLLEELASERG